MGWWWWWRFRTGNPGAEAVEAGHDDLLGKTGWGRGNVMSGESECVSTPKSIWIHIYYLSLDRRKPGRRGRPGTGREWARPGSTCDSLARLFFSPTLLSHSGMLTFCVFVGRVLSTRASLIPLPPFR